MPNTVYNLYLRSNLGLLRRGYFQLMSGISAAVKLSTAYSHHKRAYAYAR